MWRKSSRIFLPFHYVFCNFVPFWSELIWVWPVLRVAVQDVRWDHNSGSFWNGHPIYFHVFLADSLNPSTEGKETKGFIHGHVKILQLHHCFVCERSLRTTGERWSGMLVWDFPDGGIFLKWLLKPDCPQPLMPQLCLACWRTKRKVDIAELVKFSILEWWRLMINSHWFVHGCRVWQMGLCRACKAVAAKRKLLQD